MHLPNLSQNPTSTMRVMKAPVVLFTHKLIMTLTKQVSELDWYSTLM